MPIGIHPGGRVALNLLVDPWRDEFRAFFQRHVAMLVGLSGWTFESACPRTACLAPRILEDARAKLAPLRSDVVPDELRWCVERLTGNTLPVDGGESVVG